MRKVVLITGHYWNSKRKAGFHWLADSFLSQGWEVLFLTTGFSLLSIPRQDHRLQYGLLKKINQIHQFQPHLWSYVAFTPFHPANLRSSWLNHIFNPVFEDYANQVNLDFCINWLKAADLFIFESTSGLMLLNRIQTLNNHAKYIYRVSDDLHFLQSHSSLLQYENFALNYFDLISVPSPTLQQRFQNKHRLVRLEYHAIRKDLFDRLYDNPYHNEGPNVVFTGIAYFDLEFIDIASQAFPNWKFHILGPIKKLPHRPNIIAYGECYFMDTIPYLKYADLGLQTLTYRPGAESFTHSLKTIQYTYCQLPIVAPNYLKSSLEHWYSYEPSVESSIIDTLQQAIQHSHLDILIKDIRSWDEIIVQWCQDLGV